MGRVLFLVVTLQLAIIGPLSAQHPMRWTVRGDTSGAPRGCSAAAGISAISGWFAAFERADSTALARMTPATYRGRFVFSIGGFTKTEGFFVAHTLHELLPYARDRARRHEHVTIQEVTFNGWRGQGLQFGPIYFLRTADDLAKKPRPGIGKGQYSCNRGVSVLNLAPRPDFDPGPH